MKTLTYIWHDCFVARTPECSIVFDYLTDPRAGEGELPRFVESDNPEETLPRHLPLYVLVSHHHKDHFTRDIFRWAELFPNVRYILSKDTMRICRHVFSPTAVYGGPKVDPARLTVLRPGESFDDGTVRVRAFGSTDIGNSYLVQAGGARFFHAGDLNAWIWKDESTPGEVKMALDDYRRKLGDITAFLQTLPDGGRVDFCMFPVDSRIGSGYSTGAAMFLEAVETVRFFPMHFCLGTPAEREIRLRDAGRFDLYGAGSGAEFILLSSPGASVAVSRKERHAGR